MSARVLIAAAAMTLALGGCQKQAGQAASPVAAKPDHPVYVSSIGGVIPASDLPGEAGKGYLVYQQWCSGCHAPEFKPAKDESKEGGELPVTSRLALGTNLLQQRYKGSVPAALEERTDLTPEVVSYFVRHGINAMPAFRKTEISDEDVKALAAYLTRNNKDAGAGK